MIKVLIADDEPLVRAGIKTVLPWNMYGFDVISEAADGKEAYEKILKLKPDILITDIKMPGMDGLETTRQIRKIVGNDVTIIILSAYDYSEIAKEIIGMTGAEVVTAENGKTAVDMISSGNAFAEDVQLARSAGMNEHISKPLDMTRLRDVMRKWL